MVCSIKIVLLGIIFLILSVSGIQAAEKNTSGKNKNSFVLLSGLLPDTVATSKTPYLVSGALKVPKDKEITIEEGVIMLFQNFASLNIQGTLIVKGTKVKPVIFTSENDTAFNKKSTMEPAPFDWDGITLTSPSARAIFVRCEVRYSLYGIQVASGDIAMKECTFLQNGNSDFVINGKKVPVVSPHSYKSELADSIAGFSEKTKEVVQEQKPVPIQEKPLIVEQPKSPEEPAVSLPQTIKQPKQPSKRHKHVALRIISLNTALLGVGVGAFETQRYILAKKELSRLSEVTQDNMINLTSQDWDKAKNKVNMHFIYMMTSYGVGLLGLIVFVFSF